MPSPTRLKKRKRESSDSGAADSGDGVHHARSVPVAGLAHQEPKRKRRRTEAEGLAEVPAWALPEEEPEEDTGPRSRASRKGKNPFATKDRRTVRQRGGRKPKAQAPNYQPVKDKDGNKVWKGTRAGLTWFDNVKEAMALSKAGGCQLQVGEDCTGEANAIDHIKDFATEQTGLETTDLCDGKHHWKAIMLSEAQQLYNGGFDPDATIDGDELARLNKTFAWSCTSCNSSKSGQKGLDGGQATWLGKCPGEDCLF